MQKKNSILKAPCCAADLRGNAFQSRAGSDSMYNSFEGKGGEVISNGHEHASEPVKEKIFL